MRIGYVLEAFPKLSETFVLEEMLELERLGFELTVFALSNPRESKVHDKASLLKAPVVYAAEEYSIAELARSAVKNFPDLVAVGPKKWFWGLRRAAWLGRVAKECQFSHLHAHFGADAAWVAKLASSATGIPYSFTVHAVDIFAWPYLIKEKVGAAKFVVAISDYNRRYLIEKYCLGAADAAKIQVIHCGVDLTRFAFRSQPPKNDPPQLLCVGRLEEKKGQIYLLRALKIFQGQGSKFHCQIVGAGNLDGSLRAEADRLGITSQVEFTGPQTQEQVRARLNQADVFVLPCIQTANGDRDGIPVSLMEAMALGVPVVSSKISGIPELIEDEVSGLLVEPRDVDGLVAAMVRVLDGTEFVSRLISVARQKVAAEFDIVKNTKRLAELLERR